MLPALRDGLHVTADRGAGHSELLGENGLNPTVEGAETTPPLVKPPAQNVHLPKNGGVLTPTVVSPTPTSSTGCLVVVDRGRPVVAHLLRSICFRHIRP